MTLLTRRRLIRVASASAALACLPGAAAVREPIEEAGFVSIGGIDQWVAIRGRDRSRPAILFLHGGPGEAQSQSLPMFAPWEERYVVVQWDQRGSGKTFEKLRTSTPNMTLAQITNDAIDVARYVLGRLGRRKLILVGHSWGSMVGLGVARQHPDMFHAFVGTSQVIDGKQILENMRSSAVARARTAKDVEAVAALTALTARDLGDMARLPLVFKWTAPFVGTDHRYLAVEYGHTGRDAANWLAGGQFSLSKLMPFLTDFDAREAGRNLQLPFFVIQGADDPRTPPEAAHAFVDWVRTPLKGYTEIEGGHFACFTNSAGFLGALDGDVEAVRRTSASRFQ